MSVDPLSDVLSLLKPHTYVVGGFDLGGEWSIQFEEHSGVKYYALVTGAAWLVVEGKSGPIRLHAGDCVLLPNGRRFVISGDLAAETVPFAALPKSDWNGGIVTVNGGGDTMLLGGHFDYAGAHTEMLLGAMPSVVCLRDENDKVGLRWALERMRYELNAFQPGANVVVHHLAHLLLVQALRLYLSHGIGQGVGWLFALGDSKIAAAVEAIHASPGEHWTLPVLAEKAGMSRSKFAARFKKVSGFSPIDYLTRWRMLLACDRLTNWNEPISVIALSLGYESEAAFSTAFKRVMGCAPRKYATQVRAGQRPITSSEEALCKQ
ncbi:AraC family transcriptional regulator [Halomonas elongata]|uniref:AraC family transcriptional regulator n=1 Tax=Halomonas elongata TaxID=2746 RepID=UPI0038D3BA41